MLPILFESTKLDWLKVLCFTCLSKIAVLAYSLLLSMITELRHWLSSQWLLSLAFEPYIRNCLATKLARVISLSIAGSNWLARLRLKDPIQPGARGSRDLEAPLLHVPGGPPSVLVAWTNFRANTYLQIRLGPRIVWQWQVVTALSPVYSTTLGLVIKS